MKISIIIPASEKNKYSEKGDLSKWGSTSLLEWKISQAKKIERVSKIYVSTDSKKIKEIAKYYDLKILNRSQNKNLSTLYYNSCMKVTDEYILWLNCTYPYLSEDTLNNFITSFDKIKNKRYDSGFLYHLESEYFFKGTSPINFDLKKMLIERKKIVPLKKISNSAIIFQKKNMIKYRNFGSRPYFKKVNWLESLEIKNTKDIGPLQSSISYFK